MMNNYLQFLPIVCCALLASYSPAVEIVYHHDTNALEIVHEFVAVPSPDGHAQETISVFTPPYPYDTMTFTVTVPRQVVVGQEFTIYFTVQATRATNIPFWADLIPDSSQEGANDIEYISAMVPTTGQYDPRATSIVHKGGKAKWIFKNGLPADSIQKLAVTCRATQEGTKKYTTCIATNPPSFFTIETHAFVNTPHANPDHAFGIQGLPLTIPVLSNDISDLPVEIVAVLQPHTARGSVQINDDGSVTYYQKQPFVGSDNFIYAIQDALGASSSAVVEVTFIECPKPEILR